MSNLTTSKDNAVLRLQKAAKESKIILDGEPTDQKAGLARKYRLAIAKNRTTFSKEVKAAKEAALRECQEKDALLREFSAKSKELEAALKEVEDFRLIAKQKEGARRLAALTLIDPLYDKDPTDFTDEEFKYELETLSAKVREREEAEKAAMEARQAELEAERLAAIEQAAKERESLKAQRLEMEAQAAKEREAARIELEKAKREQERLTFERKEAQKAAAKLRAEQQEREAKEAAERKATEMKLQGSDEQVMALLLDDLRSLFKKYNGRFKSNTYKKLFTNFITACKNLKG